MIPGEKDETLHSDPDPYDLVSLADDDTNDTLTINSGLSPRPESVDIIMSDCGGGQQTQLSSIESIMNDQDDFREWASWKRAEIARSSRIGAQLVAELMKHSVISPANMGLFMDAVYVIEMFNKFVYAIYFDRETLCKLARVELQPFLRSLIIDSDENNDSSEYFDRIIRMLVEIFFADRFRDVTFFNLQLPDIDLKDLSLEDMIYILMHSIHPKSKAILFEDILDEFSKVESIRHVSAKLKLALCRNLIDFLCFKVIF